MRSFMTTFFHRQLNDPQMSKEFTQQNYEQLYERLKYLSYMLIITYPCFFVVDFFLLKYLNQPTYKLILASVHLTGLLISLIFIIIYRRNRTYVSKGLVVNSYVLLYLIIGAGASLNSQLFTGNIYAYVIILLAIAVILPIRPRNLFVQYFTIHVLFLLGIRKIETGHFSYISLLVNSTGTIVIAYTIALSFNQLRKSDYIIKQKLSRSEHSFRSLFNMNPKALILADLDMKELVLINKQAVEYYQIDSQDNGHIDRFLFSSPVEKQSLLKRLQAEKRIKNFVITQQKTAGQRKWSLLNFEYVDYLDRTCILIDTTDITDIKRKEEELLQHASIDMLTGVHNRRSGIELLQELLSSGHEAIEFILCFIDINNLKIVNDQFGHAAGDHLIKTCCETINCHLDKRDIIFRLGGDEFIVIFFSKQLEAVEHIWEDIQRSFQAINQIRKEPYQISASHGLYHYIPGTAVTIEEILELADMEMYKKKASYKKQVETVLK